MAIEGAQKARWTMEGPVPEVTKLPKPWKLFPKLPYPPYGCKVLVTDGKSVWIDQYWNDNRKWFRVYAWRHMAKVKVPDLGLVWPEKVALPPLPKFTPEEIANLKVGLAKLNAERPDYIVGGFLDSPDPDDREYLD